MNDELDELCKELPKDIKQLAPSRLTDDILSRYFDVNGKTVKVRLNFDTFSELIDQSIGDNTVEKLNSTLFDKLAEVFELIPRKYKIEADVYIKDFGDYTAEEAEKIVKDNIALLVYSLALERRKKIITGLSLLGGGVALLLLSYFLNKHDIAQIWFDIINISGTLLVWESANIAIIERGAEIKRAKQYIKKFKGIKLLQA